MALVGPEPFDLKDLFINVRLTARVDGELRDYMGRNTIDISFFREGVSFGITNIDIEVNTSFQPVVKITFKDLYGSTTMMANPEEKALEFNNGANTSEDNQIDYSQLFRWPPPKFNFTFKGFLGKQITWLLNLKQYSIAYNSSDASNTITAEFVPNQFGFFADIPFLYLKSVKKLREQFGDTEERLTVFEILEIGKRVEEVTQDVDSRYEKDIDTLDLIESGPALAISLEKLTAGEVFDVRLKDSPDANNGDPIEGFRTILIPSKIGDDQITKDFVDDNLSGADFNVFNNWLISNALIDGEKGIANNDFSYETFKNIIDLIENPPPADEQNGLTAFASNSDFANQVDTAAQQFAEVISKNRELLDDVKNAQIFVDTDNKVGELTISNVLSAIARDASYLMGAILDAGNNGYRFFENPRREDDAKLIGLHYPMTVEDQTGFEIPALVGPQLNRGSVSPALFGAFPVDQNDSTDLYGINTKNEDGTENELRFVNGFINSLTEAISEEAAEGGPTFPNQNRRVANPISNWELLRSNPYKADAKNIATNILLRSGVAIWHSGGQDRNDFSEGGDGLNPDDIRNAASIDFDNAKEVLQELYRTDISQYQQLKTFCDFFRKVFTQDGTDFSEAVTFEGLENNLEIDVNNPNVVRVGKYRNAQVLDLENGNRANLGEMLDYTLLDQSKTGVDPTTMVGEYVIVNGLVYANPAYNSAIARNTYHRYMVFFGEDAETVLANYPATNLDLSDDVIDGAFEIKYEDNNVGLFDANASGNLADFVTTLNSAIQRGEAYEWTRVQSELVPTGPNNTFTAADFEKVKFKTPFRAYENTGGAEVEGTYGIYLNSESTRRVAAIRYQTSDGISDTYMGQMFDLLNNTGKSAMQRIYISELSRLIYNEMRAIENGIIKRKSNLINKFTDATNDIYKQFHVLYQNWSTLSVDQENSTAISSTPTSVSFRQRLASDFGDNHVDFRDGEQRETLPERTSTAFVYQYPLQSIRDDAAPNIDIRDAIVNIDPIRTGFNDAKTTVLNVIQNVCTKNNFTFIPVPGNPKYSSTKDIYQPQDIEPQTDFLNTFHVLFLPTPETRANLSNTYQSRIVQRPDSVSQQTEGLIVRYGSPENQIVKSIDVDTEDNKVTAESIINLQALVDSSSENKRVTRDCSMLPVLAGRSYKSKVTMLGNAQVFPSQFYFLDRMPLFGGLYQIMKVNHSISPNTMETELEGIRMRFSNGGYGAIEPITTNYYSDLLNRLKIDSNVPIDQQRSNRENLGRADGSLEEVDDNFNNVIEKYNAEINVDND